MVRYDWVLLLLMYQKQQSCILHCMLQNKKLLALIALWPVIRGCSVTPHDGPFCDFCSLRSGGKCPKSSSSVITFSFLFHLICSSRKICELFLSSLSILPTSSASINIPFPFPLPFTYSTFCSCFPSSSLLIKMAPRAKTSSPRNSGVQKAKVTKPRGGRGAKRVTPLVEPLSCRFVIVRPGEADSIVVGAQNL